MNKAHTINLYYSLFLILIGLIGFLLRYLEMGDLQFTSLIPALFGIILIPMTKGIKNQNKIIAHIAVGLTTILLLMSVIMLIRNIHGSFTLNRKTAIFLLIIVASLLVLIAYVARFTTVRKQIQNK